ncbi:hypothetical protein HTZ84_05160 [Haloterrigena sp. SYSU A558-1]|uniref:Major capsid protein n=1 Tax=Haloterrigena gelatinilytica TaxID=2741724 RepID=A0ABX2LDQ4_9EURY|nr:hypothetical protein [Haloterrigena gelatinilytica]NUC71702.1 hypothetical protein [Haloterrigena gelatinilytica]
MSRVTFQNTDGLTPEVLRNTMVETINQMDRINVSNDEGYASALTVFPMVNMNAPKEGYYTFGGVSGGMPAAAPDAESPLGALTLPSKTSYDTHSYKRKVNPKKELEAELDSANAPFSLFNYGASYLNAETFIRREIVTWRGDENIDGLIGPNGADPHPDIESEGNAYTSLTSWDDHAGATPYQDVLDIAHNIKTQGRFMGNENRPPLFAGPDVIRDLRLNEDLQDRLGITRDTTLNTADISGLMSDDISSIREVAVQVPRTNANGEFIDEEDNVVDEAEDAVMDNILEPYDPDSGTKNRNIVIGMPGVESAFMPWYLNKLTQLADQAPMTSSLSVDSERGFLTQMWNDDDPISTYMAAKQDIGFHLRRPQNWAVAQV